MGWEFYGETPVGFEEQIIGDELIGDELIKVEHLFDHDSFPGIAHALISNSYTNNERDFFVRSYPYKNSPRIYEIKVPPQLSNAGYGLHYLHVRCNIRAKFQANANWRVKVSVWVNDPI